MVEFITSLQKLYLNQVTVEALLIIYRNFSFLTLLSFTSFLQYCIISYYQHLQ